MNYLLDTCVISELIKPRPSQKVVTWIDSIEEDKLYISVITIGEFEKGISKLPASSKKDRISDWLNEDLLIRFKGRILDLDVNTLIKWGQIVAKLENQGRKKPVVDSLITATVLQHDLCLVTRNIQDFQNCGIKILNPWE
ncbi:MAG TPA: VapC toxin family PIN domain ribonuclease [Candidatus Marinimicrobia bacterium]|nr:VapC toxin family PIN domain ribonuclease [Candidatus Neomarinimicrobiota bacterium]